MQYGFCGILAGLLMLLFWKRRYERETLSQMQEKAGANRSKLPLCLLCVSGWLYDQGQKAYQAGARRFGQNSGQARARQIRKYRAVMGEAGSEAAERLQQIQQVGYGFLIGIGTCLLCLVVSFGRQMPLTADHTRLQRPGQWEESQAYELEVEGLEEKTSLSVIVHGYQNSDSEQLLADAAAQLPEQILGQNTSLEAVETDLDLVEWLEGGITVSWESSDPEHIGSNGVIHNQEVDQPILVELTARLVYEEVQVVTKIPVRVCPPLKDCAYYIRKLTEQIAQQEAITRREPTVDLPKQVEGYAIQYKPAADPTPWYLFAAGWAAAFGVVFWYRQRIEEAYQRRSRLLQQEYGRLAARFAVLLQCGLSVRSCWQKMVQTYVQEKKTDRDRFSYAMEEMELTSQQLTGGMQETRAYLEFGERCELYAYRRFGMLLEQTVHQGNRGLAQLLEGEAVWAMEERKNLARKRAEEAETKMMLPMFLLLGIVIVVVMVPAWMRMQ